jgi:CheY-like chemotaxis protein
MKILIIDRDEAVANLMKSRLAPFGHIVEIHADKTDGLDQIVSEGWDIIFIDPSPLTTIKPIVFNLRRNNRKEVYIVLLSAFLSHEESLSAGLNAYLPKPLDMNLMLDMIDNAQRVMELQKHLADHTEDFPNAGGVISKSAFNQLFLASIDRADRYGESAHAIFISIDNQPQILAEYGQYDSEFVVAKLAQHLVRLRRQSDIIGQIRKNEYALLLLRPMSELEPIEAAHRFAESLSKCTDLPPNPMMDVNIRVTLMRLPSGQIAVEHRMAIRQS